MNYIISIINPDSLPLLNAICEELSLPLSVVFHAHGTAVKSMRELLGIESTERRVVVSVANDEKTKSLIASERRHMHIGVPGHGIILSGPIKSVGGGKAVAFLNGENNMEKHAPVLSCTYELIVVIASQGSTDLVMNAARAAGARGGTVLHGKGTGAKGDATFYNIAIAEEKEVILIVAASSEKAEIMRSILHSAGPGTKAGAIVFSLPISEVEGFALLRDTEDDAEDKK